MANISFTTLYDDKGHLIGFAKITRDITNRKMSEDQKTLVNAELENRVHENSKKIVSHERRFRKLIENSYDGISLFDKNLQVFYRSRSAERINGWNNVERSVQDIDSLVHPDDLASVKNMFSKIITEPDRPVISTYRTKHKLGHYIWVECLLHNRLKDADIGAIVCNFRDVTERIKAEIQLRDKNKQIEKILESITDGFIALDKDFRYTFANQKMAEMLGRAPDSLIGRVVWEVFPDAVGSDTYLAINKAMAEQQYICNEDFYEPLHLWQENHIYPSPDGLSIFIRDITERKNAEASLLESESNLRSVFENNDQAIILFDTVGNIKSFNGNANTISLNYFNKPLKIGASLYSYAADGKDEHLKQIIRQLKEQSPITYEKSYTLLNNTNAWYDVRWVSVLNNQNQQTGIILTLKNISEKKQADIERDKITADLAQRNKDLEQFTYIVSHNLRAPVANIKGLSDILFDLDCSPDTEIPEAQTALTKSINNLDTVIIDLNHILEVSSESNDMLVNISLSQLVDDVKSEAVTLIAKHNAKIEYDFSEIEELTSIKSYMYSIFQNLIINSIKYRKKNVAPLIFVSSKIENNKTYICFKDNGKGIDLEKNREQLFGLYKRFDRGVEGKGMGLYMVKMQAERLGGQINVESVLNEGTSFILELPLDEQVYSSR